jgi:hypothetical protein
MGRGVRQDLRPTRLNRSGRLTASPNQHDTRSAKSRIDEHQGRRLAARNASAEPTKLEEALIPWELS